GHRFDAIVVGEAQDLADAWWDPLLAALKDDETGGLYLFTDDGHRVFIRHGSPLVPLVPQQKERQAAGNAAYWDSFWDADQVFYGHVLGFKGLERRAVVLVVNEQSAFERSRERLYVGLSRARDQLVVCGDPDFIREVGGPDLAHRLNLSSAGFGPL